MHLNLNMSILEKNTILPDILEDLQYLMDKVNDLSEGFGLKLNRHKSKVLVIIKEKKANC